MAQDSSWLQRDDRLAADDAPYGAPDLRKAAERMGIECTEGEIGAMIVNIYEGLGSELSNMNEADARRAVLAQIPKELARLAEGRSIAADA